MASTRRTPPTDATDDIHDPDPPANEMRPVDPHVEGGVTDGVSTLGGIFGNPTIVDEVEEVRLSPEQVEAADVWVIRTKENVEDMTLGVPIVHMSFKAGVRYKVPKDVASELLRLDYLVEQPFPYDERRWRGGNYEHRDRPWSQHDVTTSPGTVQSPSGQARATQNPTNGWIFTFEAVNKQRPPADYDWTFSDTRPAQNDAYQGTVTFVTPGPQSITLTIAAGAGPPAGSTNTIAVNPVAGMPRSVEGRSAEPDMSKPALKPEAIPDDEVYDPADFTVDEVVAWAEEDPDQLDAIIAAEEAGKAESRSWRGSTT
jgi:hypothetical protein